MVIIFQRYIIAKVGSQVLLLLSRFSNILNNITFIVDFLPCWYRPHYPIFLPLYIFCFCKLWTLALKATCYIYSLIFFLWYPTLTVIYGKYHKLFTLFGYLTYRLIYILSIKLGKDKKTLLWAFNFIMFWFICY